MSVTTKSNGVPQFKRKIKAINSRLENPERVWPKVGSYLSHTARRQFSTEGMWLLGKKWTPLKPETRIRKMRKGYSRKILVATGAMKATMTSRPMDIEEYHGSHAVFGSSDPKVEWHSKGTKRNGKRINPPRPILPLTAEVRADLKQIMVQYVTGQKATWR